MVKYDFPRIWFRLFWRKTRRLWFARLLTLLISGDIAKTVWIKCGALVVPSLSLLWKSDESTKNYLIQMLLTINRRYWQARKSHICVWRFTLASWKRASLKSTRFLLKENVWYFSNRPSTNKSWLTHLVILWFKTCLIRLL